VNIELGAGAQSNWWAAIRTIVQVTRGKRLIVRGGVGAEDWRVSLLKILINVDSLQIPHLRITLLYLTTNLAHDTFTSTPKSLALRAYL
jgi:hypothetical protein